MATREITGPYAAQRVTWTYDDLPVSTTTGLMVDFGDGPVLSVRRRHRARSTTCDPYPTDPVQEDGAIYVVHRASDDSVIYTWEQPELNTPTTFLLDGEPVYVEFTTEVLGAGYLHDVVTSDGLPLWSEMSIIQ